MNGATAEQRAAFSGRGSDSAESHVVPRLDCSSDTSPTDQTTFAATAAPLTRPGQSCRVSFRHARAANADPLVAPQDA